MTKRILAHLHADSQIGIGHAIRTAKLLNSIPKIDLWISGNGSTLRNFFPAAKFLDSASSSKALALQANAINADGLLLDLPNASLLTQTLRTFFPGPVAVIDDFGGIASGHLTINGTILSNYHNYDLFRPDDVILAGGKYALIDPSFVDGQVSINSEKNKLIIVIGSSKRAFEWLDFLLDNKPFLGWDRVTVVTGSSHPYPELISAKCSDLSIQYHHALSSHELAKEIHTATAGLTTGGMIVYESLAAGLPLVVFPQIENLVPEMHFFSNHGAVVNLGPEGGFDLSILSEKLSQIRNDSNLREKLQKVGRGLIDGYGMQRSAEALRKLYGLEEGIHS